MRPDLWIPSLSSEQVSELLREHIAVAIDLIRDQMRVWSAAPMDCEAAMDILAGLPKLERFDAAIVPDISVVLQDVKQLIKRDSHRLVQVATECFDPGQWIKDMRDLAAAYEEDEMPDFAEVSRLFRESLESLDDAELLAVTLDRFGKLDPTLQDRISQNVSWVVEHSELFIPCETFINICKYSMRPDLNESDPHLAVTAEKFQVLSDEIEAAAAEVSGSGDLPMTPAEICAALEGNIRRMIRRIKKIPGRVTQKYFRPILPVYDPVVLTGKTAPLDSGKLISWRSDQEPYWEAVLKLPPARRAADDTLVTLYLRNHPEARIVILAGVLKGVGSGNPTQWEIRFKLGDLRKQWNDQEIPLLAVLDSENTITVGIVERLS